MFNVSLRSIEILLNENHENRETGEKKSSCKIELAESLTKSYSKIYFSLNPVDGNVDKKIMDSIKIVYEKSLEILANNINECDVESLSKLRKKFLENTRLLFKAEWDIIKEEIGNGLLNKDEKNKVYKKYQDKFRGPSWIVMEDNHYSFQKNHRP